MRLTDVIRETINSKYRMGKDATVNNQRLPYGDYLSPLALCRDYVSISKEQRTVLSPNTKNFLDEVENIPFSEFMELASNKFDVNWDKIANNSHRLAIIGYGGFMSNMMYFISQIQKENEYSGYIFSVDIYENDDFSAMNGVRTFQDTSRIGAMEDNKLSLVNDIIDTIKITRKRRYFTEDDVYNTTNLCIGSPDFDTRILLENKNFIFFGNSNTDFVIHRSPVIDPTMTRETYGKINIVEFWVGILEATYEFLRLLETHTPDEIRELDHNIELWSKNIQEKDSVKRHKLLEPKEELGTRRQYAEEWSTF